MRVIIARDHPNALDRRLAAREEHLQNLADYYQRGLIVDGGAFLDDKGLMTGSLVMTQFAGDADVQRYLASEPYLRDGVWDTVEISGLRRIDWGYVR